MANFDVNAWERQKLVKQLISIDENAWYDIKCQINDLAPLLAWKPIGLEEYTDHDLNHCFRIVQAIGSILPDDFVLNYHELNILIYSIIFHDLGMWTKKCEVDSALSDDEFLDFFSKDNSYEKIQQLLDSPEPFEKNTGRILLRQIVAQYNRVKHANRTNNILLSQNQYDGIISRRVPDEYLPLIGIICAAHDWGVEEVLTSELLDEHRLTTSEIFNTDEDLIVDVRLIAFLLRIGDLLDLDQRRISRIVWQYLDKLSFESEAHWRKHNCLYFKKLCPEEISIAGDFNYDRFGSVCTEAYLLATKWCDYLKAEVQTLQKALHHPERYSMKSGRRMGDLFIDLSGIKGTGIIFTTNLSFLMDKTRIIEILGDEIYDDKSAFIRELIQNALDATRTQVIADYRKGLIQGYHNLDERVPYDWPKEIVAKEDYSIRISYGTEYISINKQNRQLYYFEITDQGIGMTIDQIKKYFLQIGKSYYKSSEFKNKYLHSSISRFGIGFLSCLLVGQSIQVVTKSRESDLGLKLIMDNTTDIVSIVEEDSASYGTSVKVYFDGEIIEASGWLPKDQFDEDLMKYTHPDLFNSGKLLQAIYYWIPWSEFVLYINNRKIYPQSPLDIKPNNKYWSFPYHVNTIEDDEKVACGSIIIEKNTVIPRFDDRDDIEEHFLPSIGGIVIPPWKKLIDAGVYIDIYRQPESIITASRRAIFEIPSKKVKMEILSGIIHKIDKSIAHAHNDSANLRQALFRASICLDIKGIDLLLPVIRNGKLSWENWDERRFNTEECILVPFFIPLEYNNIQFSIPIVGVPRRRPNCPSSVIPRIREVRAINVNNICTGALTRVGNWFNMEEIENAYTYLLYRFVKYDKAKEQWEIVNSDLAAQDPIRQKMTQWDKLSGNIWETYGFDPHNKNTWSYAINHGAGNIGDDIDFSEEEIKIPKREWNLLEKKQEEDFRFKLLLKYLASDCE